MSTFLRDLLRGRRQQGGGVYAARNYIVSSEGPDAKPPPEPPAPLIDHATKIINVVEDQTTPWTLSRRELVRRDQILDKLRNRQPLSEAERSELEALLRKKELGES